MNLIYLIGEVGFFPTIETSSKSGDLNTYSLGEWKQMCLNNKVVPVELNTYFTICEPPFMVS